MTACPHGMPSPASCVDCMYDDGMGAPPAPPPAERRGPVFAASYDGTCAECDEPIHEGDLIQGRTDGRYVHRSCRTPELP